MDSGDGTQDEADTAPQAGESGEDESEPSREALSRSEAETFISEADTLVSADPLVDPGAPPGSAPRRPLLRARPPGGRPEPPPNLGPYRIDRKLGAGGMGAVYQATLRESRGGLPAGAQVAIKIVHPHLLRQAGTFERFRREALVGASVEHPNVVRTVEADSYDHLGAEFHYIALEYVEGRTLDELLQEQGELPETTCRHVGREVAAGLAAIHAQQVVHRDIKPANVVITPDDGVRILDLGLAKLLDASVLLTEPGQFAGSLFHAAPEQFGSGHIGPRADLYALGVLLYQLVSGVRPHTSTDYGGIVAKVLNEEPRRLAEVSPQVSPFLDAVVHELLVKDPVSRLAPARVVAQILSDGESSPWWGRRQGDQR